MREEIMRQMAHVRDWGGRFVVPIPTVQVVGPSRRRWMPFDVARRSA
jgi:hypothetical protein